MEIISTVILTVGVFVLLACWAAAIVMIRNDAFADRRRAAAPAAPFVDEQTSIRELETSAAR